MSWLSDFLGGGNKDVSFQTYTDPKYSQLWDKLWGMQGDYFLNKYKPIATQQWQDVMMPDIREQYETKRNPYGGSFSDTPEFSQLARESRNLSSQLAEQGIGGEMNIARLLAGITPQPQTIGLQPEMSGLDKLLSFAAPIASSGLTSYMQGNIWKDILGGAGKIGARGGLGDISNFYNPYQYEPTNDNALLAQLAKFSGGY